MSTWDPTETLELLDRLGNVSGGDDPDIYVDEITVTPRSVLNRLIDEVEALRADVNRPLPEPPPPPPPPAPRLPPRIVRRVIRDHDGLIQAIVEEPDVRPY